MTMRSSSASDCNVEDLSTGALPLVCASGCLCRSQGRLLAQERNCTVDENAAILLLKLGQGPKDGNPRMPIRLFPASMADGWRVAKLQKD